MNKKIIETYQQFEIYSEDMYMAEYGPLLLDIWCYGDSNSIFRIRVIKDLDWEKPLDEFVFQVTWGDLYSDVNQSDLKNINKYLDVYKKKIQNGEYDTDYIYSYENIHYYFFHNRWTHIWGCGIKGFTEDNVPDYIPRDKICKMPYIITSELSRFVKERYLDSEYNLIGNIFEFEHIMDLMNEFLTFWDDKVQELIIIWFLEDLQIPKEYLEKIIQLIKHRKLKKAIQGIHDFWNKWVLIPNK